MKVLSITPKKDGKEFFVNLEKIKRELFEIQREDSEQERVRKIILEALEEGNTGNFITVIMPKESSEYTTEERLVFLASQEGKHVATWVEQAIQWAQELSQGTTWETLCNQEDTICCPRLIRGKKGFYKLVGGKGHSATTIRDYNLYGPEIQTATPLAAKRNNA